MNVFAEFSGVPRQPLGDHVSRNNKEDVDPKEAALKWAKVVVIRDH